MKLIAIGDLHGRAVWKQVDIAGADQVIFLGDYTDSKAGLTNAQIYKNLREIIQLKQQNPAKISLLIGNHDAQYLHFPDYRCSGFRPSAQAHLTQLFTEYAGLFQIAHQTENYLFTHAGVSNQWFRRRKAFMNGEDLRLADQLNELHHQTAAHLLFEVGPARGGDAVCSGPVWADRSETINDYLLGYHQVVGHTPIEAITTFGDAHSSITYCDVTQTKADFYEINL